MNRIGVIYAAWMSITLLVLSNLINNEIFADMIDMKNITTHHAFALDTQGVELNIKNILVNKTSNNTAIVRIVLAVHNPNTNTVLLDGIHYNAYINNSLISSGDIGSEAVIDVMRSEPEFPVLGNDTVVLKGIQNIHTNEIKNDIWNNMISGSVCFEVNGTYFYRQAANLAASGGGNEYQIMFPNNCE